MCDNCGTYLQTEEILDKFRGENAVVALDVSFYDTIRNDDIKKRREALEQRLKSVLRHAWV